MLNVTIQYELNQPCISLRPHGLRRVSGHLSAGYSYFLVRHCCGRRCSTYTNPHKLHKWRRVNQPSSRYDTVVIKCYCDWPIKSNSLPQAKFKQLNKLVTFIIYYILHPTNLEICSASGKNCGTVHCGGVVGTEYKCPCSTWDVHIGGYRCYSLIL